MMDDWSADIPRSTRGAIFYGIAVIAVFVSVFGVWGIAAPISGAVVSTGYFVASGQNKIMQHLEGGVIAGILVSEGDLVRKGQEIITLDQTAAAAELRRLDLRAARLAAIKARLDAEIAGATRISFSEALLAEAQADPDIAEIIAAQTETFEARRRHVGSEISTLSAGIDGLNERIMGAEAQRAAIERQIAIIAEELEGKEKLLSDGFVRRPEVLALRRAQAGLDGEVGRLVGDMGDSRERIARINEQILSVRNAAAKVAVEQSQEVEAELKDVRERRRAAADMVERSAIIAPEDGIIVKMRYHTPGGVIEAGSPVAEIVPLDADLVIQARVRPQDIDSVRIGQSASVRLTALNKRTTPMVEGRVTYVSADALPAELGREASGQDGFVARIRLDARSLAKVSDFAPTPGMPAEVYIKTRERSFAEYLLQPVKDSMARAFREE
ncbi:MAG: type 1 secretion system HlyD family membrane fusion component [Saliniramus fredricksonii]|uniref:Membrane fusion protein (MFP) family protein n=1 Tax=Saliniramus fredricksonii TaxID=1653334 RepID=A0A0N8KDP8_9HYPH|nr:HlyD family type I secretion periplasmic adaptor subunit [Saliniramus fredricksonii]KPQ09138.1 MAG: type 1 secretion system HlyD family membrane fusion component [Saliniramus fredricksonii]SCC81606.1 HlyD family secretion protein [Saliniramus fredricksonii]